MVLSRGMPERSESVPSLVPLAVVGCPLTAAHHSSLPPNAPAVQMGMAGPELAPHSLRGASHAHVYTQIQLQKMPKLTKQAFFPCNPHTAVRSAMDYAAAAIPRAAQSWSGSSRLQGGLWDIPASLTKHRSPSNVRLCQKETPPCRMQPRPGAWCALLPTAGYHHGAKDCPALLFSRAQDRYHRSPPGTWWVVGWGGGVSCPCLPCRRASS